MWRGERIKKERRKGGEPEIKGGGLRKNCHQTGRERFALRRQIIISLIITPPPPPHIPSPKHTSGPPTLKFSSFIFQKINLDTYIRIRIQKSGFLALFFFLNHLNVLFRFSVPVPRAMIERC